MNFMSCSAAVVEGMHTLCHVDMSFRIQMMLSQDLMAFHHKIQRYMPLCYVVQHTLFKDAWIYAVDALKCLLIM